MTDEVREKLKLLPEKPGCYIMRDRSGTIIYVGKAVSLRRRVSSYFRRSTMTRGHPKVRQLVENVFDLEWIVLRSEDEALITENALIKQHQPKYNILLKDDKGYLGIRGDGNAPFPKLESFRQRRDDGADYFGPLPSDNGLVRPTIDYLQRRFGLRNCNPIRPDKDTYCHCNDDIIRTCSAPCIGRVSEQEYRERYEEACACLRGERPKEIEAVREKMEAASKECLFEIAAQLRDAWFGLKEFAKFRARGPSRTLEMHKADAEYGLHQLADVLRLPAPPHVIECFDISNTSGLLAVASMVVAVDGLPDHRRYRHFRIKDIPGPNDPMMIAQAVRRRYTRLRDEGREMPDLIILDGGITQLRAARAALAEIGLSHIPTCGLAEQYELLVTDDGRAPTCLPRDSEGLMVVTRLRDEAHRFAITYHRKLRNKTVRESVLDEIPGIGPAKKMQLLRTFGSINKLAKATFEELAEQPGIGDKLAGDILCALNRAGNERRWAANGKDSSSPLEAEKEDEDELDTGDE